MPGFEFSFMQPGTSVTFLRSLFAIIDDFNRAHPELDVQVNTMAWGEAWQQLMRVAIYKKGPILSEIGAPWTNDFVGIHSLRPFLPAEIEHLGGAAAFAPVTWQNCQVGGSSQVWGIPARVDVRVIYYWRDMLEKAGVDPAAGFSTPEQMAHSLERLRAAGIERPFTMQTNQPRGNVYQAASWIWGSGGELVNESGRVAFHQPLAQRGLADYFKLHPYLYPPGLHPDQVFLSRKAAVIMAGGWIYHRVRLGDMQPQQPGMADVLGVALPPGPSFVGGTNLCIWAHAGRQDVQAALALIEFLLNSPAYPQLCLDTDLLPATRAALNSKPMAGDRNFAVMVEALRRGRTHASAHLWVLLAERLGAAIASLWASLDQDPGLDVPEQVARLAETVAGTVEKERLDGLLLHKK